MSNLAQRVIVALVAIPLVLWLIHSGGLPFALFITLLSVLGAYEYCTFAHAQKFTTLTWIVLLYAAAIPLAFYYENSTLQIATPLTMLLCSTAPVVLLSAQMFSQSSNATTSVSYAITALAYPTFLFTSLLGIRLLPTMLPNQTSDWGGAMVLSMFAAIWTCDSLAYFVGRAIGKHKILPRVSPNKSWEGFAGGLVGAAIAMLLCNMYFLHLFTELQAVVLGLVIGIVGPLGDFAESQLKRAVGVKDSSAIIPGHGGILDRFDSALFVAPMLYVYLQIILR